jgi:hypothetical protein
MITHRCKGSLEANTPIRYGLPFRAMSMCLTPEKNWWLFYMEIDFDSGYDYYFMRPISVISHCPYCGEKLEELK